MAGDKPVVLITGCSKGGIGYALCESFHSAGCQVVATARRLESMDGLPTGVAKLSLDVTSEPSIAACVQGALSQFSRIDVLVNNAGGPCTGPLAEMPLATARANYELNVWGPLAMVQAVAPSMCANKKGTIINIGSVVSYLPLPFSGIYGSSKAAVMSMTDTLRREMSIFNVKVVYVAPGAIRTNIFDRSSQQAESLPKLKLYAAYEERLKTRSAKMLQQATPVSEFGAALVKVALAKDPPRHFMYGAFTWQVWLARWMPLSLVDAQLKAYTTLRRKKGSKSEPLASKRD